MSLSDYGRTDDFYFDALKCGRRSIDGFVPVGLEPAKSELDQRIEAIEARLAALEKPKSYLIRIPTREGVERNVSIPFGIINSNCVFRDRPGPV